MALLQYYLRVYLVSYEAPHHSFKFHLILLGYLSDKLDEMISLDNSFAFSFIDFFIFFNIDANELRADPIALYPCLSGVIALDSLL